MTTDAHPTNVERVLVLNGPNLNLLGTLDPERMGYETLQDLDQDVIDFGAAHGIDVSTFQSNHEGDLIDHIHEAAADVDGIVINASALAHSSYAIYDALVGVGIASVEVHISNPYTREPWRRTSVTAPASLTTIYGRGRRGYTDAMLALMRLTSFPPTSVRYGDDPNHVIDVRTPISGGGRLAVMIHGGFWRDHWQRDTIDGLAIDLMKDGWVTANVEYRRVGSGGGWPTTIEDVTAAIEHLVEADDPQHVAVIGHSAGGQLALCVAAALPDTVDTAVSLAGVVDLVGAYELDLGDGAATAFLGGSPTEVPDRYHTASPRSSPFAGRHVVVHGVADDAVPVEMSRSYVKEVVASGAEVTYLEDDDADHFDLIDPTSSIWQRAKTALG